MAYVTFSAEIIRSEPGGQAIINAMDAEMSKKQTPLRISDVSRKYAVDQDDQTEDEVYWVEFSLPLWTTGSEPIFAFAPVLGVDAMEMAVLCDEMIDSFHEDALNDN